MVKRKNNVLKKAFLTEQVSSILQCKLPIKYKDPGCPTISCRIGTNQIERALLDLGASVNLLPYSVYLQLGLGELKPTSMILQLADRLVKRPRGIIEDVLIKVDKFYFPVNFIVIDTEPVHNVGSQIPVILGRPSLATANALINCRTGVMKISFGNMTVGLNIFDINKQPLDYDEVRSVCLIEEITDKGVSDFCLEDFEVECFAQHGEDMDCEGLREPTRGVVEPSLANTMLENFVQLEYDVDFDELVEQAEVILDPVPESQAECGETTELSFPTPYSSAVELPELISDSKWVGPIHVWPRWPSVTIGRKKNNELFQTRVQRGWKGCIHNSKLKAITRKDHFPPLFIDPLVARSAGYSYYSVFDGYSSYNHVTLDPGKQENTTLTYAFGVFACCQMPSGSCNAPAINSLAEDCKLNACGRQPIATFSFCYHLIWFSYFVFVVIVFFRKSVYRSSLGERSPTFFFFFFFLLFFFFVNKLIYRNIINQQHKERKWERKEDPFHYRWE
jgi:hypothetical protein